MTRPVLAVVHVIDNLRVGGAQQLLLTYAREARRRGGSLTVVTLEDHDRVQVTAELERAGAEVVVLARSRGRSGLVRQAAALRALLRERAPVAVQTHLTRSHCVAGPAGRLAGVPVVATLHNTEVGDDGNSDASLRLETLVLRRLVSAVVAVGPAVEQAQRARLAPGRAHVVPNAVEAAVRLEPERRRELRAEVAGDPEVPLLLAVGRLVEQKGYDDLLSAFADIAAALPSAVLVIAGDGPLHERLSRRAFDLGLGARLRLLGGRADVHDLLAAADLYVSASRWEGLPVALLEAMAAGLPIVTTAVGDVPSAAGEGCAVLVAPQAPQQFAQEVLTLLDDDVRRAALGAAAAARARSTFGPESWFDVLQGIYAEVRTRD